MGKKIPEVLVRACFVGLTRFCLFQRKLQRLVVRLCWRFVFTSLLSDQVKLVRTFQLRLLRVGHVSKVLQALDQPSLCPCAIRFEPLRTRG